VALLAYLDDLVDDLIFPEAEYLFVLGCGVGHRPAAGEPPMAVAALEVAPGRGTHGGPAYGESPTRRLSM
jgi:hypothetical protein